MGFSLLLPVLCTFCVSVQPSMITNRRFRDVLPVFFH